MTWIQDFNTHFKPYKSVYSLVVIACVVTLSWVDSWRPTFLVKDALFNFFLVPLWLLYAGWLVTLVYSMLAALRFKELSAPIPRWRERFLFVFAAFLVPSMVIFVAMAWNLHPATSPRWWGPLLTLFVTLLAAGFVKIPPRLWSRPDAAAPRADDLPAQVT